MRKTAESFEANGIRRIKDDDHAAVRYQAFVEFVGR